MRITLIELIGIRVPFWGHAKARPYSVEARPYKSAAWLVGGWVYVK